MRVFCIGDRHWLGAEEAAEANECCDKGKPVGRLASGEDPKAGMSESKRCGAVSLLCGGVEIRMSSKELDMQRRGGLVVGGGRPSEDRRGVLRVRLQLSPWLLGDDGAPVLDRAGNDGNKRDAMTKHVCEGTVGGHMCQAMKALKSLQRSGSMWKSRAIKRTATMAQAL